MRGRQLVTRGKITSWSDENKGSATSNQEKVTSCERKIEEVSTGNKVNSTTKPPAQVNCVGGQEQGRSKPAPENHKTQAIQLIIMYTRVKPIPMQAMIREKDRLPKIWRVVRLKASELRAKVMAVSCCLAGSSETPSTFSRARSDKEPRK